jgi:Zn-dependent protease with chaperone function
MRLVAYLPLVVSAWLRTTALAAAHRRARCLPGTGQVVVLADQAAAAYAAPGWPGRIVVTSGMLGALTNAEREVLLAHERAHASGRHYLFTTAARLAAAANPLLRPLAATHPHPAGRLNLAPGSR